MCIRKTKNLVVYLCIYPRDREMYCKKNLQGIFVIKSLCGINKKNVRLGIQGEEDVNLVTSYNPF